MGNQGKHVSPIGTDYERRKQFVAPGTDTKVNEEINIVKKNYNMLWECSMVCQKYVDQSLAYSESDKIIKV